MRYRNEILLFVILLSSLIFSQDSLMAFFREISGKRDFLIDGSIHFHVRNDSGGFSDFRMDVVLVIGNLEDLCLYVERPEVVSGIVFAYIRKANRLYSGFSGKIDMNVVYVEENFVEDLFLAFVDIITSPFFKYSVGKVNGKEVYRFFPGPKEFLSRVGIEPITIDVTFVNGVVKGIKITGEDEEEFVELSLRRFEVGFDASTYFSYTKNGNPVCVVSPPYTHLGEVLEGVRE